MNRYTLLLLALAPLASIAQSPAPAQLPASVPAQEATAPLAPAAPPTANAVVVDLPPSPYATCETAMTTRFANYASAVAAVERSFPRHILFSETTVQCGQRKALMFLMVDPTHALPARLVAVDVASIGPSKK